MSVYLGLPSLPAPMPPASKTRSERILTALRWMKRTHSLSNMVHHLPYLMSSQEFLDEPFVLSLVKSALFALYSCLPGFGARLQTVAHHYFLFNHSTKRFFHWHLWPSRIPSPEALNAIFAPSKNLHISETCTIVESSSEIFELHVCWMSEISMFRKLFVCTQCNTEKFHARIIRVFMQELLGFSKTAVDKVKKNTN